MLVDLAGCLVQVDASKAWFNRRVLPLTLEQVRWRPQPRHWSIAECLDHLNLTLTLYLPQIDQAIGRGWRERRTCEGHPRRQRCEGRALREVEPPARVRLAALPALVPAAAVDPERLVDQFHRTRDRFADAVRRASGLDLSHIPIADPLYPMIHSLGGAIEMMAAHDRRHMWQAEQVRKQPRFPQAL